MLSMSKRHQQEGMTLIEMIVALTVLAIIIVPLTAAFVAALRSTDDIDQRLTASRSRQLLAAKLTPDVQSVDGTGVSYDEATACTIDGAPADDTLLMTLNNASSSETGTEAKRTSYWITGSGRGISLIRRHCEGEGTVDQTKVLDRVGLKGQVGTDAIQGATGPGTAACDDLTCTINVDGKYTYSLQIERRVLGAAINLGYSGKPRDLTCTPASQRMALTWLPPIGDPDQPSADLWRIHVYDGSGNPVLVSGDPWVITIDGALRAYTVTGLTNDTPYSFRIVGVFQGGAEGEIEGTLSDPCSGTPVVLVPGAPELVNAALGDQLVDLEWAPPNDDGGAVITSYEVQYRTSSGSYPGSGSSVDGTSTRISGLTNGTTYVFRVRGFNEKGASPWSNELSQTPRSAPCAPQNVRMVGADGPNADGKSVRVTWDPPSCNGGSAITTYRLDFYRFGDYGSPATYSVESPAIDGTTKVVTDDQLINGLPVGVRMVANNTLPSDAAYSTYWSVNSDPATRTCGGITPGLVTPSGRPGPAANVVAANAPQVSGAYQGKVAVTWTKYLDRTEPFDPSKPTPNGANLTRYRLIVEQSTSPNGTFTQVGSVADINVPDGDPQPSSWTSPVFNDPGWYRVKFVAYNKGEWDGATERGTDVTTTDSFFFQGTNTTNVPVVASATFSSSGTTYDLQKADGTSGGSERTWPGRFSGVGGTEGSSVQKVEYLVKRTQLDGTTVRYYDPFAGSFAVSDERWMEGSFGSGGWYLDWPLARFDQAGKYQVITRTTPVGGSPTIGDTGTFYIDWNPTDTVFVQSGASGNGLNASTPIGTIASGLTTASTQGRSTVAVAGGSYGPATLSISGSSYANNRTVTGGHSTFTWLRSAPGTNTTTLTGAGTGVEVDAKTGQILRQLAINSGAATGTGASAYGVRVVNSAGVKLDSTSVVAQNGVAGSNGTNGSAGSSGAAGGGGTGGCDHCGSTGGSGGSTVSAGGAGGSNPGRQAGNGGSAGASGGGCAGSGGSMGYYGGSKGTAGCGGAGGAGGAHGGGGANAAADFVATFGSTSRNGSNGSNGSAGRGGGGGGAGGAGCDGSVCVGNWLSGGAGGGGGGGGGGGTAGTGATAGGGSFGVYTYNATVTFANGGSVASGNGANGGTGGNGGNGGGGGSSGAGGNGNCTGGCGNGSRSGGAAVGGPGGTGAGATGNGGNNGNNGNDGGGCCNGTGGSGGSGGAGGAGGGGGSGGGGAGGPTIAILKRGTGAVNNPNSVSQSRGTAGSGGSGGTNGTAGAAGGAYLTWIDGTTTVPVPVEYLVVGGGGAGAPWSGGGGGAGGLLTNVGGSVMELGPGTYNVTVGAGGSGCVGTCGVSSDQGQNGGASQFASVSVAGGGGGGANAANGRSGGSGGGGGCCNGNGGAGIAGQGYNAANTASGPVYYGAGGGAGSGGTSTAGSGIKGGNGGPGTTSSINGTSVVYAGGGGGGCYLGTTCAGTGGGGNGGFGSGPDDTCNTPPGNGTANRGSGGGGNCNNRRGPGGNGGSGIVIIRYPGAARGTGGTITSAGGYTIHTFTTSGSLVIT